MLTVLLVTSAVRSNPDLTCINLVIRSLTRIKGLFPEAKLHILADGYKRFADIEGASGTNFKKALVNDTEAERYHLFIDNLRNLVSENHANYAEITVLDKNLGFAKLVEKGVEEFVDTPLVMVIQHDWAFRRPFEIQRIVHAFDVDHRLNYVTWSSNSTINYPIRLKEMYGEHMPDDFKQLDTVKIGELECWPLDFFYDRNHIARTQFYRDKVFQKHLNPEEIPKDMRVKRFIEDSFGHHILSLAKEIGPWKLFEKWGLACIVEPGEILEPLTLQSNLTRPKSWKPMLLHLDARKYLTNDALRKRFDGKFKEKQFVLDSDSDDLY
jgi:hypothetical protein